jgi:hypothetical protein
MINPRHSKIGKEKVKEEVKEEVKKERPSRAKTMNETVCSLRGFI